MPLRRIQQEDLELMLSWRNHQTVRLGMFSQSVIEIENIEHGSGVNPKKKLRCGCCTLIQRKIRPELSISRI